MKKISIIIILILLSSCSIGDNSEKEINTLNNSIKKDNFNKKLECAKLIKNEEKWLKNFTNMDYNFSGKYVNKDGELGIEKKYSKILEVFYSDTLSSCVSVIQISYNMDMSYSYRYILRDILENKKIGDYYNWNYYNSSINQYGDGNINWTEKEYPSLCDKSSKISHCVKFYEKLNELKNN